MSQVITPLRVGPKQLSELCVIRDLSAEKLGAIFQELNSGANKVVTVSDLRKAFGKVVDEEIARLLVRHFVALASFRRKEDKTPQFVMSSLRLGIVDTNKWTDDQLKVWDAASAIVAQILESTAITIAAKALDLSYDYQNVLRDARIITDIRPVFDVDRTEIVGAVISQTFKIEYTSDDGAHAIAFAIDENDIRKLRKACDLALTKSEKSKIMLTSKCGVPAFNSGEENYDA